MIFMGKISSDPVVELVVIKRVAGAQNLMCPTALSKIAGLNKEVNAEEEIRNFVKSLAVTDKTKLNQLFWRYKPCYSKFKNDSGKVDDKYTHKLEGGIKNP